LKWNSDFWLIAYIFTPEQFSYFQSNIVPSWKGAVVPGEIMGFSESMKTHYEAIEGGSVNAIVSLNVTQSGDYVAVLTNVGDLGSGAARVDYFTESVVPYLISVTSPTLTPPPTSTISHSPSPTPTQKPSPDSMLGLTFQTALVITSVILAVVIGVGLIVYSNKHRH
jgi:hypothetical protein